VQWQMDDPEARVKSSLSDSTWLEDLSMDLSSRHLRTYEAKHTFLLFPSHFFLFFLSSSFFLTFLFFLSYFFHFFAPQNFFNIILTQHLTKNDSPHA
jgi:hypothetical protein